MPGPSLMDPTEAVNDGTKTWAQVLESSGAPEEWSTFLLDAGIDSRNAMANTFPSEVSVETLWTEDGAPPTGNLSAVRRVLREIWYGC